MKRGSLRLRLLAAGAASTIIALSVAGVGLLLLFERHVERRMEAELGSHLLQLVSGMTRSADGAIDVANPPVEPRFVHPLSGLYWQVGQEGETVPLRSRSLWDSVLELPDDDLADAEIHRHTIPGPGGTSLLAVERRVTLPVNLGGQTVRAVVALDRAEVHAAGLAFASDLVPSLAILATVLVAAAWIQVGVGLRPLHAVRDRLAHVRSGAPARLGTAFPNEVLPLAAEVDHLLDAQERAISRARARAADLAHGLKTPLTVLAADAAELRTRGDDRLAEEIESLTESMRRHVERELVRARGGMGMRSLPAQPLAPAVAQVVDVLRRTPRGLGLQWQVDVPPIAVRADMQDLTEIVGNLAENALHWATGKVRIESQSEGDIIAIRVEDDGPGVPDDQIDTVLIRGRRLDETRPGTGLGLAIVGDLVDAYGGSLSLQRSSLGGLLAEVRLPGEA